MSAILHPVAANADQALNAPLGRAARAAEAAGLAGAPVRFATEFAGPAFATREAALDAFAGRVEDERPGRASPEGAERYCRIVEMTLDPPPPPAAPTLRDGRRWPAPPPRARTVWRLSIGYWRIEGGEAELTDQARQLRRSRQVGPLPAERLRSLGRQPLRPVKPQQPLDIGLFEVRLPEAPHIVVADE